MFICENICFPKKWAAGASIVVSEHRHSIHKGPLHIYIYIWYIYIWYIYIYIWYIYIWYMPFCQAWVLSGCRAKRFVVGCVSFLAQKKPWDSRVPQTQRKSKEREAGPEFAILLTDSRGDFRTFLASWHFIYDDSGCDRKNGPTHHVSIGVSHYVRVKHELRTMFLLWNQSKCMRCTFYRYQMISKMQLTPSIYLSTQVSKFERGFVLLDPVRSVLHELQKYLRIVFESGEVSLVAREKELSFTWFWMLRMEVSFASLCSSRHWRAGVFYPIFACWFHSFSLTFIHFHPEQQRYISTTFEGLPYNNYSATQTSQTAQLSESQKLKQQVCSSTCTVWPLKMNISRESHCGRRAARTLSAPRFHMSWDRRCCCDVTWCHMVRICSDLTSCFLPLRWAFLDQRWQRMAARSDHPAGLVKVHPKADQQ